MSFFNFKKSGKKPTITIKVPSSFDTNSLDIRAQLILQNVEATTIDKLAVKLRADPASKKSNASSQYLGESNIPEPIELKPNEPGQVDFDVPIDFGPIDDFDIPPENLAMASAEMKAAAASNRTTNYQYNIEVSYKTSTGLEEVLNQPIRLVQQDEVRIG